MLMAGRHKDLLVDLRRFAEEIGLEKVCSKRYSAWLLLQMFHGGLSGDMNAVNVVREIEALENPTQKSQSCSCRRIW